MVKIPGKQGREVKERRAVLTTGGFVEIVADAIPNTSYIRIHLGVHAYNRRELTYDEFIAQTRAWAEAMRRQYAQAPQPGQSAPD